MSLTQTLALPVVTYLWVIGLSLLSALATYFNHIAKDAPIKRPFLVFLQDVVYCLMAGFITFFLSKSAGADDMVTAALVATGSHMGARLVFTVESLVVSVIELKKKGQGKD